MQSLFIAMMFVPVGQVWHGFAESFLHSYTLFRRRQRE